jgi:DNA-binding MarR family transcriptional regulator
MTTPDPADTPPTGTDEVMTRISRAWREMRRGAASTTIKEVVLGTGPDSLEGGQWDTLDMLSRRESWRMGDLADALLVEPSTATRAVQRLTTLGLAERVIRGGDGRVVHVAITALGRTRHGVISERSKALMESLMSGFTDRERTKLADLLDRFVQAIARAADEATRRTGTDRR